LYLMEPMRNDAFIFYTFILFVLNLRPFQTIYTADN